MLLFFYSAFRKSRLCDAQSLIWNSFCSGKMRHTHAGSRRCATRHQSIYEFNSIFMCLFLIKSLHCVGFHRRLQFHTHCEWKRKTKNETAEALILCVCVFFLLLLHIDYKIIDYTFKSLAVLAHFTWYSVVDEELHVAVVFILSFRFLLAARWAVEPRQRNSSHKKKR